MAFKNGDVIDLLKKRGSAIKKEQWDYLAELDKEINELKNEKLNELTSPCSIFMTFETEEGVNRALKMKETIDNEKEKYGHLAIFLDKYDIAEDI